MLDIFKAELARFRYWAVALMVAHAGFLVFVDRLEDPLRQPAFVYKAYLGLLLLLGLFFGLFQLSSYARQAAWIDLLHRPLAARRIGAAILVSGLALTAITIAVPVALLLLFHQLLGAHDAEARHLLFPLAAWALGATGYCMGVHLRLGHARLAWSCALLPVWIFQAQAHGPGAVLIQLAALGIAFFLALADFRPDRAGPRSRIAHFAETGLVGLALAVFGAAAARFLIQFGLMLAGTHPLNGVPPAGGVIEAIRADGGAIFAEGLDARDPRQRFWMEQAALSEVITLWPQLPDVYPRYSLTSGADNAVRDGASKLLWGFSHDSMRYAAIDLRTRQRWKLPVKSTRLPEPPLVMQGGSVVVAGYRLLRYDGQDRRFVDRIRLPATERLIAPPEPAWDRLVLLSDRALRIYDARVMRFGDQSLPANAVVTLPRSPGELVRIDLLELLDGYLICFTFGEGAADGRGLAEQQFWLVDEAGASRIAMRELGADYPAIMRYADFWLAPAAFEIAHAARYLLAAPNRMAGKGERHPTAEILALALLTHLVAGALAWRRGTRLRMRRGASAGWAFACLIFGLSLFGAFWLSVRRKPTC